MSTVMVWFVFIASARGEPFELQLTERDVSLYAPLDGTADPMTSQGAAKPAETGTLTFVPGVRGQAMLFKDKDGFIDYTTRGILSTRAGAISIWVRPLDWGRKDTHIRHFVTFSAGPEDSGYFCWLYKYFAGPAYFLVWEPEYGRPVLATAKHTWKQGEWNHFVATWNGCRMMLYTNGVPSATAHTLRRTLLPGLGAHVRLGGSSDPEKRSTLLDEFYISNRELTAAEAKAFYEMDNPGIADSLPSRSQLALPKITTTKFIGFRARQYPGIKKVVAGIDLFALQEDARRDCSFALALRTLDGEAIQETIIPAERAYVEHAFDSSKLVPGHYELTAELRRGERVIDRARAQFTLEQKPVWLDNSPGLADGVVEPWTPMESGRDWAACWGRRVRWGKRMLPAQITSQGIDLLAEPIRIVARSAGRESDASDESFTITGRSPQRITFAGTARFGPLAARLKGWMEFDGMLWMTVTISAPEPTSVDELTMEIPMRPAAATLMIAGRGTSPDTGAVKTLRTRMEGRVDVWIGCEKAGLSWAWPDYRFWHCPKPDPRIEIVPRDRDLLVKANWISQPMQFTSERAFTFALIPSPVRPKTKGWRKWAFGNQPGDNPINIFTEGWSRGHGYPAPGEKFKKWYARELATGKRLLWYLTQSSNSPVSPAYRTFGDEWATSPQGNRKYDADAGPKAHTNVCPGASSLSDWLLWAFKKHISDAGLPVSGVYVDVTGTPRCANRYHGCGYVDAAGNTIPTLPILGVRRWQKHLYTFLRKRHPGAILMNHESANIHLYQLGFCDTMIDGENLTMQLQKKPYTELLPLDTWRAEYMGHPFGYVAMFLPEFTRSFAGDKKKRSEYLGDKRIHEVEYIAGMGIVHDTLIWPAYSNPRPYLALKQAKKTFGWDEKVEFLPYWDNADAVTLLENPDPKRIVCSLYKRPGRVLAAIMNTTTGTATVHLKLNHEALKTTNLADASWLDAYEQNTFEYTDYRHNYPRPKRTFEGRRVEISQKAGVVNVSVRPNNFRLLLLER